MDYRIENLFIPFKEAKQLKKLGFDMECFGHFENEEKILRISYESHPHIPEEHKDRPAMFIRDNRNSKNPQWMITAPTYQQVFEWFREEHKLHGELERDFDGWCYKIIEFSAGNKFIKGGSAELPYEEAELGCLRALIEIIKK